MTTTDTPQKYRYEGNGVTDTFAFNGRVFAETDLVVEIITRATDVLAETLTISTHYDVTILTDGTAEVEITSAPKIPSVTQDILVRRVLPQSQSAALPTGTPFPAKVVETALDRVTALVQDLQEEVDRSIKIPVTDSGTLPDALEIVESAETATAAAATATAAAAEATAAAASVNLPALGVADTVLQVNAGGSALEYGKIDTINISDNAVGLAQMAGGTDGNLITYDANGDPAFVATGTAGHVLTSNGAGSAPTMQAIPTQVQTLVQRVGTTVATTTSGTATIPTDDTIPQSSEGIEAITLAITPTNASNVLRIMGIVNASYSATNNVMVAALFQDSTAGALAAFTTDANNSDMIVSIPVFYEKVAGTTSATTFKIRIGGGTSSTVYLNSTSAGRKFGGVFAHKLFIEEFTV